MVEKNKELKKFENLEKELKRESNTAASASARRQADSDLAKIRATRMSLASDIKKERLARESNELREPKGGALVRGLEALSTPGYAISGIVESALGKGEGNVLDTMADNIKRREGFTSIMKEYNAPSGVALPLGIALDIMFDPVNWVTAGAGSLVGRTAIGASKAGLKGAAKGASSRTLEIASKLAKPIEIASSKGVKGKGAFSGKQIVEAVTNKANKSSDDFFEMIGQGGKEDRIKNFLKEKREDRLIGASLWKTAMNSLDSKPKLKELVNKFRYNDGEDWWAQQVKLGNAKNAMKFEKGRFVTSDPSMAAKEVEVRQMINNRIQELKKTGKFDAEDIEGIIALENQVRRDMNAGLRLLDGTLDTSRAAYMANPEKMAEALSTEGRMRELYEKATDAVREIALDDTGIDWYDDIMRNIKLSKKGQSKVKDVLKNMLRNYETMVDTFKTGKIGASPTAYANSIMGNPAMFAMYGGDLSDKNFWKYIAQAARNVQGKVSGADVDSLVDVFGKFAKDQPDLFRSIYGVDKMFLDSVEDARNLLMEFGVNNISGVKLQEFVRDAKELTPEQLESFRKIFQQPALKDAASATQSAQKGTSTLIAGELRSRNTRAMLEKMETLSRSANATPVQKNMAKAVIWYFNKPMSAYEKIDQSYRLGTAMYLAKEGVSEGTMRKLSRFVDIDPTDVEFVKSTGKFKISPEKASEVVLDVYMNYAAMPAAIKMLRQLPIFGSPFASFMYGMAEKTARTAAFNPQVFNNYEFVLNSFRSIAPQYERDAILNINGDSDNYYEFYANNGMLRLPFFQKNPIYVNLANAIPWYSLNIFDSVNRGYEKSFGGGVAEIIDRSPFMKTPEGQLLLDYILLPTLYQDAENVRGAFGQRVVPKDATIAEKTAYGIRSAVEIMMPGALGLAGLPAGAIPPLDKYMEVIPSYRARSLGYALSGRDPAGVIRAESAASRTARNVAAAAFGISAYQPNFDYSLED